MIRVVGVIRVIRAGVSGRVVNSDVVSSGRHDLLARA